MTCFLMYFRAEGSKQLDVIYLLNEYCKSMCEAQNGQNRKAIFEPSLIESGSVVTRC